MSIIRGFVISIILTLIVFSIMNKVCEWYLEKLERTGGVIMADTIMGINTLPYVFGALTLLVGLFFSLKGDET